MSQIRIAFIGCGVMSSQLQRCIPMISEFNFIATCDLVEERAQSNARNFGALRHYTNYDEMLRNEDLNAVAVVGRPEDKLHRDIGIECLERGYHIYIEKPPATTIKGEVVTASPAPIANQRANEAHNTVFPCFLASEI